MKRRIDKVSEPKNNKRLLSVTDRVSEILFGLFMALTFTCTISIINTDRTIVKDMLIGAIGCNVAWGLVDAVMFLITSITEKGRGLSIYNFVRNTKEIDKAQKYIADSLPSIIASGMSSNDLEAIRKKLTQLPAPHLEVRLSIKDYKSAFAIFLLVFFSTFPITLPFVFIADVNTALRISNFIAILMMFICGWILGKYAGRNKFFIGIIMSFLGILLVLITIELGG